MMAEKVCKLDILCELLVLIHKVLMLCRSSVKIKLYKRREHNQGEDKSRMCDINENEAMIII